MLSREPTDKGCIGVYFLILACTHDFVDSFFWAPRVESHFQPCQFSSECIKSPFHQLKRNGSNPFTGSELSLSSLAGGRRQSYSEGFRLATYWAFVGWLQQQSVQELTVETEHVSDDQSGIGDIILPELFYLDPRQADLPHQPQFPLGVFPRPLPLTLYNFDQPQQHVMLKTQLNFKVPNQKHNLEDWSAGLSATICRRSGIRPAHWRVPLHAFERSASIFACVPSTRVCFSLSAPLV